MFDYYKMLWWDSFSEKYFDYLIELIKKINIETHHDLACWSWHFVWKMLKNNFFSTGSNISDEQIKIAQDRYWEKYFSVKDMTDFELDKKVDLITCNNDAINHLYSLSEWEELFTCVYKNLNEKWYFIFDFHTLDKINNTEKSINQYQLEEYDIEDLEESIWNNFYRSKAIIKFNNKIIKILKSYHTSFNYKNIMDILLLSWFRKYIELSISTKERKYILAFKN